MNRTILAIKGAIVEGRALTPAQVAELATLPSKIDLFAKVLRSSRDPAVRKTALNTLVHLVDPSLAKEGEKENEVLVQALREALREGDGESKGLVAIGRS